MKGNNEINFCEAEVYVVFQHYLDTVLFKESPGDVYAVKKDNGISGGFVVHIKEREIAKGEKGEKV